jgi:hypothetical protein
VRLSKDAVPYTGTQTLQGNKHVRVVKQNVADCDVVLALHVSAGQMLLIYSILRIYVNTYAKPRELPIVTMSFLLCAQQTISGKAVRVTVCHFI